MKQWCALYVVLYSYKSRHNHDKVNKKTVYIFSKMYYIAVLFQVVYFAK